MKTVLSNNLIALTLICVVLSLGTGRSASGDVLVDANLIAYWQFSGDAKDSSGYGNDGTLGGNATVNADILTLDGNGDYVNCGDVDVDVNSSFTLSVWLRPASTVGDVQAVLTKGDADDPGDDSYGLYYMNDDTFCFYVSEDGGWENCAYVYTVNTYSEAFDWYHVVATLDGTDLAIYVNGTEDTGSQTGSVSGAVDNDIDTLIGARVEGAGTIDHFYGDIDEVMIYNRALEEWEVRKLYNKINKTYGHFNEAVVDNLRGSTCTATGFNSVALGFETSATGLCSIAMGCDSIASNSYSVALGCNPHATGMRSCALGAHAVASGDDSIALGLGAHATYQSSLAAGEATTASGRNSIALGRETVASASYSTAIGRYSTNNTAYSFTVGYGEYLNEAVDFRVQSGQVNVYGDLDVDETVTASEVVTMDKLVLPVKTTTGNPASPVEGQIYVNTYDNKVRVYADGAWRDLATW